MSDSDSFIKLKKELKTLFRSEDKDLNFGIYRIMNQLNKEIDEFIDKELSKIVEEKILELQKYNTNDIDAEIEELRKSLEKARIDPLSSPAYKELLEKKKENRSVKEFEDEVYNNLVRFFSRYYQDGDFITKFYFNDQTYLIPYDGSEVELYWPTKDMYFVKTSDNYQRFSFGDDKSNIVFKVVTTEEEKGNQKQKDLYFDIDTIEKINEEFIVSFKRIPSNEEIESLGKNKTGKQKKLNEKISETIREKTGIKTDVEKNLEKFQRRYTEDYFIHKNLKVFLEKQLIFFINQDLLNIDTIFNKNGVIRGDKKIIAITFREIALNIIDKLALLENLKKKIWEKKKFVLESNYVITLDKIAEFCGEEFLEKIIPEILVNSQQLSEWNNLFGIVVKSRKDLLVSEPQQKLTNNGIEWKKLPTDTKYFSLDFKWKLLSYIPNLDDKLNGILIHSENWQALNVIEEKYRERIKCCYIDPPYNTGNDEFSYVDKYRESSWFSLMENRLEILKDLLKKDGIAFVQIDDVEHGHLKCLMDQIFGIDKFCVSIAVRSSTPSGFKTAHRDKKIIKQKDLILVYINENALFKPQYIKKESWDTHYSYFLDKKSKTIVKLKDKLIECKLLNEKDKLDEFNINKKENIDFYLQFRDNIFQTAPELPKEIKEISRLKTDELIEYKDSEGKVQYALNGRRLTFLSNTIKYIGNGQEDIANLLCDIWYDIDFQNTQNEGEVELPSGKKPEKLLSRLIEMSTNKSDILIDFFLGSGTTCTVAHKIGRIYIGVEVGLSFNQKALIRFKHVLYGEQSGISKDINWQGGGFLKYHEIEQYEDALENIQFKQRRIESFENYEKLLQYYLEDGIDKNKSRNFLGVDTEKEFLDLKIKILNKDGTTRDQNVDLIETFNYLIGIEILQMKKLSNNGTDYYIIKGMVKDNSTIVIWRDPKVDKEKDKEFINKLLQEKSYKEIFVNSDCLIKNYKNIYDEMRKRLW